MSPATKALFKRTDVPKVRSFTVLYVSPAASVNALLANLPRRDGEYLASLGRIERPPLGRRLAAVSDIGTDVWFPHSGAVALLSTDSSGRSVQTAIIGNEGCVGFDALFSGLRATQDAIVQIEGEMSVIPGTRLRAALEGSPNLQIALGTFLYDLVQTSSQTMACNRLHSPHARCCRWLLALHDIAAGDDLPLTQEDLATLVGGGRPRVNLLLATLESDGILQRHRRRIRLLQRAGLERQSCECYHLIHNRPRRSHAPTVDTRAHPSPV